MRVPYTTTEAVVASTWLRHNPRVRGQPLATVLQHFGLQRTIPQDGSMLLVFADRSQFRSSEPRIMTLYGPIVSQEKAKPHVSKPIAPHVRTPSATR